MMNVGIMLADRGVVGRHESPWLRPAAAAAGRSVAPICTRAAIYFGISCFCALIAFLYHRCLRRSLKAPFHATKKTPVLGPVKRYSEK